MPRIFALLSGTRNGSAGLWTLPIAPADKSSLCTDMYNLTIMSHSSTQKQVEQANNAYTMSTAKSCLKYLHQCLFSPPTGTLVSAIHNNQLKQWPSLTAPAVRRYLPATSKGHMRRPKQDTRSTRPRKKKAQKIIRELKQQIEGILDSSPDDNNDAAHHVFYYAALADKHDNTLYLDGTGIFPYQ